MDRKDRGDDPGQNHMRWLSKNEHALQQSSLIEMERPSYYCETSMPSSIENLNPYRKSDGSLIVSVNVTTTFDPSLIDFEKRMKDVADCMIEADAFYDRIPESGGGKIINTDLAREFLKEYRLGGIKGRRRFVHATGRVAQAYVKDRLWREIQKGGDGKILLFLAGGVAAGKTSGVAPGLLKEARLVCDGTLRETAWGIKSIQQALDNKWEVSISYIQRPLRLVAEGVIERADRTGRWSPYATLPNTHQDAQRSIIRISKHFFDVQTCKISFALNEGTVEEEREIDYITLDEIDTGGIHSYG